MKLLNEKWEIDNNYPTRFVPSECKYFNSLSHAIERTQLKKEDIIVKNGVFRDYIEGAKKPFPNSKKMVRLTHSAADFNAKKVTKHNKILNELMKIDTLEELLTKYPNAVHSTEMGYWSMHHNRYNRPIYVKLINTSDIDPPHKMRYARGGEVAEDCCWLENGVIYYTKKGDFFEDSIN